MGFTIDIDTGGTFTDGFVTGAGRTELVKVPTTPHDLTICFTACIEQAASQLGLSCEELLHETDVIRFSNTIGTNCLIVRDGSKVGLLVTAGSEHLAPSGATDGKAPLVATDMVLGVDEEVSGTGAVVRQPSDEEVLEAGQELIDRGARCLVVAFRNAELDPANERKAYRALKREYPRDYLGAVPVFLASNLSWWSGERERVNAAVINAYIHDKLARLLYKAGEDLRRRRFRRALLIGHSNGGVARVPKTRAISTYNSGPACGLVGARRVAELYGVPEVLSADMGGTSFDLGYVKSGQPAEAASPDVEGFRVNVPMLAIRALGAGGGSIARVDGDAVLVGPASAGAVPGPAAFGLGGTEPTVTDANLVLGVLDPGYFLGGTIRLDPERARAALEERIAGPLGITALEGARRVRAAVDGQLGLATADLKREADLGDDALLLVYGGAGPAHCCDIAEAAGLRKILITPFSAVFSAFGSSTMDVGHVYYRRVDTPLDGGRDSGRLEQALAEMRAEAQRDLRGEGFSVDQISLTAELFVRGAAEEEVRVPALPDFLAGPSASEQTVERAREALLDAGGTPAEGAPFVTVLGLRAQAPVAHYELAETPGATGSAEAARKGARAVFLGPEEQELAVYQLAGLGHGHVLPGPAIVESETTTILVRAGWTLSIDRYGNCVLEAGPE